MMPRACSRGRGAIWGSWGWAWGMAAFPKFWWYCGLGLCLHAFLDQLQFVKEQDPSKWIDVLKLTAAYDHVITKFEYSGFTFLRLCSGIESIFDTHFLQPTIWIRLHMLSTAMTNDVVGGGGILPPAPPFKNVGFSLAGYSVMWMEIRGWWPLLPCLPPWLAGRSQDYDADDAKSW